jgi:Flp pilus assembly pilin Flp
MFRKKRGQSALEYALVISVAVLALIAINVYMKRGVQGRLKASTDQIGKQFDPNVFTQAWRTTSTGNTVTTESRSVGGNVNSSTSAGERIGRVY